MQQIIENNKRLFRMDQHLGEKAMAQVADSELSWQANEDSNSIVTIVKHLWGNMLSRWTDFLTTDGEKPWRQRDAEFENPLLNRQEMMLLWNEGWQCLFHALDGLTDADLDRVVYIRNEGHTVMDALSRQVAHYAYHVGQIVYLSKLRSTDAWKSLSIPRNQSAEYNAGKFAQEKATRNFADEWIDKNGPDDIKY